MAPTWAAGAPPGSSAAWRCWPAAGCWRRSPPPGWRPTGWGTALAVVAFTLIGVGVGACGTTLLVLLAKRVDERRRAAAATTVWLMMIVGFVVTAGIAGHFLDPFSPERLVAVIAVVAAIAVRRDPGGHLRHRGPRRRRSDRRRVAPRARAPFREALAPGLVRGPGAPLHRSSSSSPCSPTAPRT